MSILSTVQNLISRPDVLQGKYYDDPCYAVQLLAKNQRKDATPFTSFI
jgi:hypothetical protein